MTCLNNANIVSKTNRLSTIKKIFRVIYCGANKTNASLETFTEPKGKRTIQLNMIDTTFIEIMSSETEDVFNVLWFKYLFTSSLLRNQSCKLQGCMIRQPCNV